MGGVRWGACKFEHVMMVKWLMSWDAYALNIWLCGDGKTLGDDGIKRNNEG